MMTRTTKALIVLTSNDRRGAEIEGATLGKKLAASGMSSTVVALAPGSSSQRLDVPTLGTSPLGWRTLRALRRLAKEHQVVIAFGSKTLPACSLGMLGVRTPFIYRSIGDPGYWIRGRLHRLRTALLLRRARCAVVLWPSAADTFVELYHTPQEAVGVIPNHRPQTDFSPPLDEHRSAARESLGVPTGALSVLQVGALTKEKRVDRTIRAVAHLPEAHLTVVGEGPLRCELETLGTELLGERVSFVGVIDEPIVAFHAADVITLFSESEGMPGVVLEAGLCGVPVVASEVGAIPWMLENQMFRGSVVPQYSTAKDWADEIRRVSRDSERMPLVPKQSSTTNQWLDLLGEVASPKGKDT